MRNSEFGIRNVGCCDAIIMNVVNNKVLSQTGSYNIWKRSFPDNFAFCILHFAFKQKISQSSDWEISDCRKSPARAGLFVIYVV